MNEVYIERIFSNRGTHVMFRLWNNGDFEIEIDRGRDAMSVIFDQEQAKEIRAFLFGPETRVATPGDE